MKGIYALFRASWISWNKPMNKVVSYLIFPNNTDNNTSSSLSSFENNKIYFLLIGKRIYYNYFPSLPLNLKSTFYKKYLFSEFYGWVYK